MTYVEKNFDEKTHTENTYTKEDTPMTRPIAFLLLVVLAGCAVDREAVMASKFDAGLRNRITGLAEDQTIDLIVRGTCASTIDGIMRQSLIDAGADVQKMEGDEFVAKVTSEDVFSVGDLEFVQSLRLVPSGK